MDQEFVAIVARVVKTPRYGYVAFQPVSKIDPPQPEMGQCLKHGRVIFFAAGTWCPACDQIEDLKFADV